ncbi:MAG: hypothetical protein HW403_1477, partial [Dehalococcoidia bacterium]|nr:hypothetical protein [Dehalococcoidia bacterium]
SFMVAPRIDGLDPRRKATLGVNSLEVILSGDAPELRSLSVEQLSVSLSLVGLGPGRFSIEPIVKLPDKMTLVSITPKTVEVQIQ